VETNPPQSSKGIGSSSSNSVKEVKAKSWADLEEEIKISPMSRLEAAITAVPSNDNKADKVELIQIVKSLNSSEDGIRKGAIDSLLEFLTKTTKVTRNDVRMVHRKGVASVLSDREAKSLKAPAAVKAAPKDKPKVRDPLKDKLEKDIAELRKRFPVDQRGVGSEYAALVKALRDAYNIAKAVKA